MSRTITMITAAILLGGAGTALAAAPKAAPQAKPATGQAAPKLLTRTALIARLDGEFKGMDKNGDGVLTKDELGAAELASVNREIAAAHAKLDADFAKLDTQKTGKLTLNEFMAMAPSVPTAAPDLSAAFAHFDGKKDGKVTLAEFQASQVARFDQLDPAHKGSITINPGQGGPKTITRTDFLSEAANQFRSIDTTNKGYFTKAELSAAELKVAQQRVSVVRARMEAEFQKLDTDKDGKLSRAEFNAAVPNGPDKTPDGSTLLARFDTKHDGRVTLDEYRAPALATFDKIDTNHDGILSVEEMKAAREHQ